MCAIPQERLKGALCGPETGQIGLDRGARMNAVYPKFDRFRYSENKRTEAPLSIEQESVRLR